MEKPIERRWRLKTSDPVVVRELSQAAGISLLHAQLLANRGVVTPEQAAEFISPTLSGLSDPFLMIGVEQAVERLVLAKTRLETVCVHGDYDCLLRY